MNEYPEWLRFRYWLAASLLSALLLLWLGCVRVSDFEGFWQ